MSRTSITVLAFVLIMSVFSVTAAPNLAPSVAMSASKTQGAAPLAVVFTAAGVDPEGSILNYHWDFGDGATAMGQVVVHVYDTPGTYTVVLTAEDSEGNSATAYEIIQVDRTLNLAPSLTISVNKKTGDAPLTIVASAVGIDPEKDDLSYYWDFGDGTTIADKQVVVHTYYNPGTYTITCTAEDPAGNTATAYSTVLALGANSAPSVSIMSSAKNVKVNSVVAFSGYAVDREGDQLSYIWDFGDGSPVVTNLLTTVHTFSRIGTFTVTLTVEDSQGNTGTAYEQIIVTSDNLAPSASIYASPESGEAPLTVVFSAYAFDPENDDLSYYWDFGDGSPVVANLLTTVHTFYEVNSYEVRLTVEDANGNSVIESKTINVGPQSGVSSNIAPFAYATATPLEGYAPLVVVFTGRCYDSDGEIVSYQWEFGDGYTSSEQNVAHTFVVPGVFNARFSCVDNNSAVSHDEIQIVVLGNENMTPDNMSTAAISIFKGWNLISIPVEPANNSINAILGNLNYTSVWRMSGDRWQSYVKGAGGLFSTLEPGKGYWVYSNENKTIPVTGIVARSVHVNSGWNLVGYGLNNQAIKDSMQELDIYSVWRWNARLQEWESYLDELKSGDFSNLEPGKGYWIYAKKSGNWTY